MLCTKTAARSAFHPHCDDLQYHGYSNSVLQQEASALYTTSLTTLKWTYTMELITQMITNESNHAVDKWQRLWQPWMTGVLVNQVRTGHTSLYITQFMTDRHLGVRILALELCRLMYLNNRTGLVSKLLVEKKIHVLQTRDTVALLTQNWCANSCSNRPNDVSIESYKACRWEAVLVFW